MLFKCESTLFPTYFLRYCVTLVAIEHIIQVVVPCASRFISHVLIIRLDGLISCQDLSLLRLSGAHDFISHEHLLLALPISCAWLALVFLFLSFKD